MDVVEIAPWPAHPSRDGPKKILNYARLFFDVFLLRLILLNLLTPFPHKHHFWKFTDRLLQPFSGRLTAFLFLT